MDLDLRGIARFPFVHELCILFDVGRKYHVFEL